MDKTTYDELIAVLKNDPNDFDAKDELSYECLQLVHEYINTCPIRYHLPELRTLRRRFYLKWFELNIREEHIWVNTEIKSGCIGCQFDIPFAFLWDENLKRAFLDQKRAEIEPFISIEKEKGRKYRENKKHEVIDG